MRLLGNCRISLFFIWGAVKLHIQLGKFSHYIIHFWKQEKELNVLELYSFGLFVWIWLERNTKIFIPRFLSVDLWDRFAFLAFMMRVSTHALLGLFLIISRGIEEPS